MNHLRILHIAKYYEPFKGGIEKVIFELASGSVKAGHEVVVLSSNIEPHYREDIIEGVKVIRLPRLGVLFSQPLTLSLFWQMKKWLQWADVAQVHTPNPLAEAAFLLQDCQKPLIVTYHCDVVRQKVFHKMYQPIMDKLLSRADQITVSTPNHLKFSPALQSYQNKSTVIPFGVRAKHAKKTMAINEHLHRIKQEVGDYFLFIGRLVPYKGVDVLLRALKQTNEKVVIIGQGPRFEAWYSLARDLGVLDQIKMLGQVSNDDEFAAYLHGCKSLVLPSIDESEAFGIVLIEAMSCAKPVITTNLKSGVPWVNDKNVTGLEVEPRDVSGLSQALNTLGTDRLLRQQMGEAAAQRFEKLFRIETMVQLYLDLYEQMESDLKISA